MASTTDFDLVSLFQDLAGEAAARDAAITLPHEHVAGLKHARIGALRLPQSEGGAGIGLVELYRVVYDLAAADPSVAHALRNHFAFVEQTLQSPADSYRRRWISRIADGELVGGSFSEAKASKAGLADFQTVLSKYGSEYRLNGVKIYSTGNIYADHLFVKAMLDNETPVTVAILASRAGVDLTDDWDGIGQRLTGSGTTRYSDVVVHESEIVPNHEFHEESNSYSATFPQLYLTTVIAGIVSNVLSDAVELVRGRARNYYHGAADEPRHEAAVQNTVGRISTNSFAITSSVLSAAASLDRAWSLPAGAERDDALLDAALDASRTKVFVDECAAHTSWLLFELGGGSTPTRSKNLDRHWRNIRTLSSHNRVCCTIR